MTKALVKLQNKVEQIRSEKGATAVEYGLMVALIAVVIIVAVYFLGTNAQHAVQHRRQRASDGPRTEASARGDCVPGPAPRRFRGEGSDMIHRIRTRLCPASERGATAVEYALMVVARRASSSSPP